MSTTSKKYEFQSEAKQILDLMIHSVYSNPDIFLRELISNASDAIDKLRIENLSDTPPLDAAEENGRITIKPDAEKRTITVSDNGIGLSRDDLVSYLGTIARSGTKEFIAAMQEAKTSGRGDLIGQFGIGFYSSFIVADKVTVLTKKAGESEAFVWESEGDGTYTISEGERDSNGTDIILHLKESAKEEQPKDYLSSWVLREIIKKYSDFVTYPIMLIEVDKEGNEKEDGPVNSMKALWTRPESEVTAEEYNEFYRHITHDWTDPMEKIVYKAEGTNEYRALLYIPSMPPMDLFYQDGHHGVDLYIKRVFIMSDCRYLIPEYLRFIKGVVDSEDLPLNVSREILQQDARTAMIKNSLTRKILDALKKMKQDKIEDYEKFWQIFGMVLKEGIISDVKNRETLMKLCLLDSSNGKKTTLEQYKSAMKEDQKSIYFITGASAATLAGSPKLEAFKKSGTEVLLLGDPVDEIWVNAVQKFEEIPFVSVSTEELDMPKSEDDAETEEKKYIEETNLAAKLKKALGEEVEDVKISSRLVDSPVCFVQKGEPISQQMRNFFKAMGRDVPEEKRVLELNPGHPLIKKIAEQNESEDKNLREWGELLLGLAAISDGEPVPNGADFTKTLSKLLEQ